MDRSLASLSSEFRLKVNAVLAGLTERGVAVMIVQTGRTVAEHQANLASGASRAAVSKHLPRMLQPITGLPEPDKCDAIDLCPFDTYALRGPDKLQWSDDTSPEAVAAFKAIGELGEAEGLRWGGRWHDPHDPGHLELLYPGEHYKDIPSTSAAYPAHGIQT